MYGVGFSHTNASFISFTGASAWGFYVAADGDARVWLDGSNGVVSSTGQHYVGSNVVWNAGNDGSGSGLDADTLDGHQATAFLRSDTTDAQTSGSMTFGRGGVDPDSFTGSSGGFGNIGDGSGWGASGVFVHGGGTGDAAAMAHNGAALFFGIQNGSAANSMETWLQVTPGTRLINFTTDNNSNNVQIGGNKIFHAGNDGSGSGLDADLLDGLHASSFCRTDTTFTFNGSGNDINIDYDNNRNLVRIQRSGTEKFMLGAAGNEIKINTSNSGYLTFGTSLLVQSNNTYDLGSSSARWRNIYTNDLNLSNEGSANDVDGTWGNFTIQEGENDLFLINKRNGKKYKFNLTEV